MLKFFTYINFKILQMNTQIQQIITINNADSPFKVSARELYTFFGYIERFSKWWGRYSDYGFENNIDYTLYRNVHPSNNQEIDDYLMTIDMAKEISMLQRSEKGKQARHYFLEVEKKLISILKETNELKQNPFFELIEHNSHREVQVQNSKDVNKLIYEKYNGDIKEIAKYNNTISKGITGKNSKEWQVIAKERGLKSIQRTSGKEALRNLNKSLSIGISSADDIFTKYNATVDEAIDIGKATIPLAEKMMRLMEKQTRLL